MTELIDEDDVQRRQLALAVRLETVRRRIDEAGSGAGVTLLAVSKGHPVEAAVAARRLGLMELGENYAQELAAKAPVVANASGPVGWHFIGQLQTNKVPHDRRTRTHLGNRSTGSGGGERSQSGLRALASSHR